MSTAKSYEEIIDFIAAGTTPEAVLAFHPSDGVERRVADLVERSKTGQHLRRGAVGTRGLPAARARHDHGQSAGASTYAVWQMILSESLRRFVAERAGYRCEYCLLHEDDSYSPHQLNHIISRKHGGHSHAENLAYACLRCNAWKGSDIGSVDAQTGTFVSLFHPRRQRWEDHFVLQGAIIEPLTGEGEATARVLKLNLDKRVVERKLLAAVGRYPR